MNKGSVLVVDDETDILELCLKVLQGAEYAVHGVACGRDAIALSRSLKFDLLLTDINMPDIRGLDVAQAVKQNLPEITCVIMTGFGSLDLAIEALKLGVDDFILKPFGPNELLLAVSKALEKQHLRRENARLKALIPLFELTKTLMSTTNMDNVLKHVVHIARKETGANRASLALLEEDRRNGRTCKWVCVPTNLLTAEEHRIDQAVAEAVWQSRRSLSAPLEASLSTEQNPAWKLSRSGTLLAHPLMVQERLIGVLIVAREDLGHPFRPSDSEFLYVLSGQAAIAIENAKLFQEIERAYQELKELDRLKSEFINIAAHELRTPLAILLGYVDILNEEVTGELKEHVEVIMRNGLRLRTIIDDMLDLRQLETGQAKVRTEVFALKPEISSVVQELAPLAQDKNQHITIAVAPEIDEVKTDRNKFHIVLANLLSNAIKFSDRGGEIRIEARMIKNTLEVAVSDNGIGIPAEEQERIFSRFYQIEDSLTRTHGGMGIGLSIAKGMVELCGGQIRVESKVGQGSTFTFTLPQ